MPGFRAVQTCAHHFHYLTTIRHGAHLDDYLVAYDFARRYHRTAGQDVDVAKVIGRYSKTNNHYLNCDDMALLCAP